MRHRLIATLCLCGLPAIASAQTLNEKIFHNPSKTTASTRDQAATTDRLYFMQPQMALRQYGKGGGFRGVLQDQNQATAEPVRLAFVAYAGDNVSPDTTAAGTLVEASYQLFGTGTGGAAYLWTMTFGPTAALPQHFGLRLTLAPANGWPADGCSVHYQNGTTTKVPAAVTRPQWTFVLAGNSALAFATPASTFHLGGLYEEPVTRHFVNSSAYGAPEDLLGPESLWPDSTRGDKLGWSLSGAAFPGKVALPCLAAAYGPPIPVGPPGTYLMSLPVLVIGQPLVLDAAGNFKTAAIPVPPALQLATQTIFLDPTATRLRLSDAARISGL
jgi:hypothetical protein